jgi:hypothetical protein
VEQPFNSGAPPVLVAFGKQDLERLQTSGIGGFLATNWEIKAARGGRDEEANAA